MKRIMLRSLLKKVEMFRQKFKSKSIKSLITMIVASLATTKPKCEVHKGYDLLEMVIESLGVHWLTKCE
jgi:hypothetical protein